MSGEARQGYLLFIEPEAEGAPESKSSPAQVCRSDWNLESCCIKHRPEGNEWGDLTEKNEGGEERDVGRGDAEGERRGKSWTSLQPNSRALLQAPRGPEPLFLGSVEGNKQGRIMEWRQKAWFKPSSCTYLAQSPHLQNGLHIFTRRDVTFPAFPSLPHSATELLASAKPGI